MTNACLFFFLVAVFVASPAQTNSHAADLVNAVRQADYRADRQSLASLYRRMEPLLDGSPKDSRIHYWRGFAMWRRAINAMNETKRPPDVADDLQLAIDEFDSALAADHKFVDAKIGEASCLMILTFLNQSDTRITAGLVPRFVRLLTESRREAPENPRFYWVNGSGLWYMPPSRGGGESAAIAGYQKGLDLIRTQKRKFKNFLDPTWGEPELLMNLAWSNLHRQAPDLVAASRYAHEALRIVPNWHYLRDILLPDIRKHANRK